MTTRLVALLMASAIVLLAAIDLVVPASPIPVQYDLAGAFFGIGLQGLLR